MNPCIVVPGRELGDIGKSTRELPMRDPNAIISTEALAALLREAMRTAATL